MKTREPKAQYVQEFRQIFTESGSDSRYVELMRELMASARLLEVLADHSLQAAGLSVPRLRLLIWLRVEERRGNKAGVSPSALSHFQHVSKNTVSSLLASLEVQGLIERTLSREDKRKFSIRLSNAGRELVCAILPKHSSFLAETLAGLSVQEQATLVALLHKLCLALVELHLAVGGAIAYPLEPRPLVYYFFVQVLPPQYFFRFHPTAVSEIRPTSHN